VDFPAEGLPATATKAAFFNAAPVSLSAMNGGLSVT
jgi:hypothetical protein